jgi:hypothetical protein
MNTARTPHFLDDLDDGANFAATERTTVEEIQKNAHIANGGTQEFKCPACRGGGRFITYTGRDGGPCFKCKGKGQITKGQNAAIKGKATKLANQLKWRDENKAAITYMHKRAEKGNNFYAGLIAKMNEFGTLTENQLRMVQTDIDKDDAFWKAKKAEQDAARPTVPTAALEALFNQAKVKLAKTAIFRTVDITINKAKATGVNPGALYVKKTDGGEYCGKIVNGKWIAKWGAPDVTEALQKVAADPTAEAIAYALKFKACCCCGQALYNPVSVLAVVGPVCAPKWGLDHLRLAAAKMLADEKAEDQA